MIIGWQRTEKSHENYTISWAYIGIFPERVGIIGEVRGFIVRRYGVGSGGGT